MAQDAPFEPLTRRERDILTCLVDGLSNQEIANRLFLSVKTVRWYNSQIYSKLGVGSRQEAIEQAGTLGLLDTVSDIPAVTGKHNLPAQATPFVGRQNELGELMALLNDPNTRLITILAPGGMGKTRLALEAAQMQISRSADGVYFMPLAPLSSVRDMVTTLAENIGLVFYGDIAPAQQLLDFLRPRALLLVLDNFEHLLEGAPLVGELVQAAPRLRVLTTSRERLNLRGETVYSLRGMGFPSSETSVEMREYEAGNLFIQSAQRVRPDFRLQADDLSSLGRICRLTGGMPLGIELAAGWLDVLTLEQVASELQRGIDILETELRDVPERQRSVRTTFDHTWARLTEEEQRIFMWLSVFRGGFTVEAAGTVVEADVRSLRKLANKALVQVAPDGRHHLHELLRQYGTEKLTVSGQQAQVQAKHAAFFADFMSEREQDIRTDHQLEALAFIDSDFENIRSAWLYTAGEQAWEQLPKFLHSFSFYFEVRERTQEPIELLEHAIRTLGTVPSSDVTYLARGRVLAWLGGGYKGAEERAAAVLDEAIGILRRFNSPQDLIAALLERQNLALPLMQLDLAASLSQEAFRLAASLDEKRWEGDLLSQAGWTSIARGDMDSALQFAEDALAGYGAMGNHWGMGNAYHQLAWVKVFQQDYERAKPLFEQALTRATDFASASALGLIYLGQAQLALHERDHATARSKLRKGLQIRWDAGYSRFLLLPLVYIAQMFAQQGELERAVEILAVVAKGRLMVADVEHLAQTLREELESELGPARFLSAWSQGQAQELSIVVTNLLTELADT